MSPEEFQYFSERYFLPFEYSFIQNFLNWRDLLFCTFIFQVTIIISPHPTFSPLTSLWLFSPIAFPFLGSLFLAQWLTGQHSYIKLSLVSPFAQELRQPDCPVSLATLKARKKEGFDPRCLDPSVRTSDWSIVASENLHSSPTHAP